MYMISCILLGLLLLVSMVPLKCTNSPLVFHFLNFFRLFLPQILLIIILPVLFMIFFHPQYLMITLAKILSLLFLNLRMQIFLINFLFPTIQYIYISIFNDIFLAVLDNEQDSLNFLNFLNKKHPNIYFNIEKQVNHSMVFLNEFISGINNQNLTLQTYCN